MLKNQSSDQVSRCLIVSHLIIKFSNLNLSMLTCLLIMKVFLYSLFFKIVSKNTIIQLKKFY